MQSFACQTSALNAFTQSSLRIYIPRELRASLLRIFVAKVVWSGNAWEEQHRIIIKYGRDLEPLLPRTCCALVFPPHKQEITRDSSVLLVPKIPLSPNKRYLRTNWPIWDRKLLFFFPPEGRQTLTFSLCFILCVFVNVDTVSQTYGVLHPLTLFFFTVDIFHASRRMIHQLWRYRFPLMQFLIHINNSSKQAAFKVRGRNYRLSIAENCTMYHTLGWWL